MHETTVPDRSSGTGTNDIGRRREARVPVEGVHFTLSIARRELPTSAGGRRWGRHRETVELFDLSVSGAGVQAADDLRLAVGAAVSLDLDGAVVWATVRNGQDVAGVRRYGVEFHGKQNPSNSPFFAAILAAGIDLPWSGLEAS
jgi:hypothetical protein